MEYIFVDLSRFDIDKKSGRLEDDFNKEFSKPSSLRNYCEEQQNQVPFELLVVEMVEV